MLAKTGKQIWFELVEQEDTEEVKMRYSKDDKISRWLSHKQEIEVAALSSSYLFINEVCRKNQN